MNYQILLYYKYTTISDPEALRVEQELLCKELGLKGRIIIASEGINGTVEGGVEETEKYILKMLEDPRFEDIHFKKSTGNGLAFPKLSVKVRSEIVSGHLNNDIDPNKVTGKYLKPEELHQWIADGKKFYIVDMRNDYEHQVGYFKDSILAPFTNFRDLPKILPALKDMEGETIIAVCTGGVRCEKASGFLIENGFEDVYQLEGGIVSYMERFPNEDFLGKLYVFDGRIVMGFNTTDPKHVVVGRCKDCNSPADKYVDCKNIYCKNKRHFITCEECLVLHQGFCSGDCKNQLQEVVGG